VIDTSEYGFQFRGYPVTVASGAVMSIISGPGHEVARALARILREAKDTAEPGEPAGWLFRSRVGTAIVYIERFGGIRETDRHEGAQWSVYLPSER
jgi:hypothetical protein